MAKPRIASSGESYLLRRAEQAQAMPHEADPAVPDAATNHSRGLLPMEVGRVTPSPADRTVIVNGEERGPADRTVIVNGEVRGPDWTPSAGTAAEQFEALRQEAAQIPPGQRTAHELRAILGTRKPE